MLIQLKIEEERVSSWLIILPRASPDLNPSNGQDRAESNENDC